MGARRKLLILTGGVKDAGYPARWCNAADSADNHANRHRAMERKYRELRCDPDQQRAERRIAPCAKRDGRIRQSRRLARDDRRRFELLGGYATSPLAPVMPVTMKPPQIKKTARAGSGDRQVGFDGAQRQADLREGGGANGYQDAERRSSIGVIGFDSQPFVVVPLQSMAQNRAPSADDRRLSAHGTTF